MEALASSLGLPQSGLTQEQLRLRNVKVIGTLGAALGVGCGCLMGMSCLLFMDLDKADRLKKKAELRTLYATLMEEGHKLIGAEHCALFLLDAPYDPKQGASDLHLTSMGWKGKEPTKDELDEAFREMDEDKSGTVSALELYHALRMNGWTADLDDVERMIRGSAGEERASKRGLRREEFGEVMRSGRPRLPPPRTSDGPSGAGAGLLLTLGLPATPSPPAAAAWRQCSLPMRCGCACARTARAKRSS